MSLMHKLPEPVESLAGQSHALDHRPDDIGNSFGENPTAVLVVPPWPRSGTARIIQNQTDYYRSRGFRTLLLVVPFHWAYMNTSPIWTEINEGIQDLGADQVFVAALEPRRYKAAKYTSSLRHAFRGTALDWIIDLGRSTRLPDVATQSLHSANVALFHVNHVYTLGFALELRQKLSTGKVPIPIILDTHDVQSHLVLDRGDLNPWTKKQDTLERLVQTEIAMLRNADILMHLSVDDIKFFEARLPGKPHILSLPTIDETFVVNVEQAAPRPEPIDLLFVGQSHMPNLAAMKWFFSEVWPHIADRKYSIQVVGAVEMFVREYLPKVYEEFRSFFVGPVADLAGYYRSARCVIAPMVSGSGISIKTIEALALGKPFVGTSKAFRGMPMDKIEEAGLRAYDEPQSFAAAIAGTLERSKEASLKSRQAYDRLFSRQASFATRDAACALLRKGLRTGA